MIFLASPRFDEDVIQNWPVHRFGAYSLSIGGCSLLPADNIKSKMAIYVTGVVGPVLCIGTCYCLIFCFVWHSKNSLMTRLAPNNSSKVNLRYLAEARLRGFSVDMAEPPMERTNFLRTLSVDNVDCFQFSRQFSVRSFARLVFGRELRLTKMMALTYVAVVLCYMPAVLTEIFDEHICYPWLNVLVALPVWASGVFNPVIYVIMSQQYRQAYKSWFERFMLRQRVWSVRRRRIIQLMKTINFGERLITVYAFWIAFNDAHVLSRVQFLTHLWTWITLTRKERVV